MKKAYTLGLYEKAMPNTLSFMEMLSSARAAGFDRLEISIDETDARLSRLNWDRPARRELRDAAFELETPIETMCLSAHRKYPLGSHDAALRARSLEIMEKAVEFAQDVGIRIIQLAGYDVYYEQGDELTRAMFGENLKKCVDYAASAGVILGFETMETPFMDTVDKAMTFVDALNSPYLGVYPDIGNLKNASVLYGSSLVGDIALGRGHTFAAHLKETFPGVYRDRRFGDGHTEYVACIKELYGMGVRMYTGEFWYLGEEDYMATLKEAAAFLRDKLEAAICENV